MQVHSKRLVIEPLAQNLFSELTDVDADTREAMNGLYASRPLDADFFWYTYWQMSRASDKTPVGGLCFMGGGPC